jgi:hypothetical protein
MVRRSAPACGTMGVITALEFFQHLFAKLGHRDLLNFCDPTLSQPLLTADSRARGSVRRASGFVQIAISPVTHLRSQPSVTAICPESECDLVRPTNAVEIVDSRPLKCQSAPEYCVPLLAASSFAKMKAWISFRSLHAKSGNYSGTS